MGLFSSIFGNPTSDAAQKARQDALNAFNAVKTPALSDLQVQLSKYVDQGILTPEQAETQLMSSNAFNEIATDPSSTAAQKQALVALQKIGTQGGMTAVDKAQLNDIENQQNADANGRNAAVITNARERGVGNSNLTDVSKLVNEQGAANRAAESGTTVAANAQTRALQAIQAAGQLGGSMEAQEYGEKANKANAANAIEQFNTTNQNATNMANVNAANAAAAANLANKQNISNANTNVTNTQETANKAANQTIYEDNLRKATGIAGVDQNTANAEQAAKNAETGADIGLISGVVGGVAKAAVPALGAASAASSAASPYESAPSTYDSTLAKQNNPYDNPNFYSNGGKVSPVDHTTVSQQDVEDFQNFMSDFQPKKMAYGGSVDCKKCAGGECMSHGGMFGNLKKGALHKDLGVAAGSPIPESKLKPALNSNNETLRKRAQFAENAKHFNHADGGVVESTGTAKGAEPVVAPKDDRTWAEKLAALISKDADIANNIDKSDGGEIKDFRAGGPVPGVAKVMGDSPINDVVPAKLSPGEVVLPRTVVKNPERIPSFVEKSVHPNPNHVSSALRSLMNPKKERE